MLIGTNTPVQLLVTDPQGRSTGFDPSTAHTYHDIPASTYTSQYPSDAQNPSGERSPTQYVVEIVGPPDGTYVVELSTPETRPYTAYFYAYDETGTPSTATQSAVLTGGSRQTYLAHYSTAPGQPIQVEPAPPVGGIAELPDPASTGGSGMGGTTYAVLAGAAAGVLAFAALAGLSVRRRRVR